MSTADPKPLSPPVAAESTGQKRRQERGSATRGEKNPGKRLSQVGN